jgi:AraC-like DNA-binding protein
LSDPPRRAEAGRRTAHVPAARATVAEFPPGTRLPWRRIDDHELVWLLQGRAVVRFESHSWELGADEVVLLAPGVLHEFAWDPERTTRHGYVHFTGPLSLDRPVLSRAGRQEPVAALLRYLLWLASATEADAAARERTIALLVQLVTAGPLPADARRRHVAVEAALRHVAGHWRQMPLRPIPLRELAAAARASESLLHRLFRAEFGHPPAAALERVRLLRARALLADTALPVATVALSCGFSDAAHLAHRCRAVLGVSPKQLRSGDPVPADHGAERLAVALWGALPGEGDAALASGPGDALSGS